MLTCVTDAQEDRDVAVVDIPNAFAQTVMSKEDADHRVIVCIRGPLVDILVSIAPNVYGPYVSTTKTGQKVLIVECINAIYGTMVAALLCYYKNFVKSLVKQGFKLNPYDGCVANKIGGSRSMCVSVLITARFPMRNQKWLMKLSNGSEWLRCYEGSQREGPQVFMTTWMESLRHIKGITPLLRPTVLW
jgi:hypothetical protein